MSTDFLFHLILDHVSFLTCFKTSATYRVNILSTSMSSYSPSLTAFSLDNPNDVFLLNLVSISGVRLEDVSAHDKSFTVTSCFTDTWINSPLGSYYLGLDSCFKIV